MIDAQEMKRRRRSPLSRAAPLQIIPSRNVFRGNRRSYSADALITHSSSGTRATTDATGLLSYTAGLRSNDHTFVDPDWVRHLSVDGSGYSNFVTYSEDCEQAGVYNSARATFTKNVGTAPDGTTTLGTLIESTDAASTHWGRFGATLSASTVYCSSWVLKANGRGKVKLSLFAGAGWPGTAQVEFDLTDGSHSVVVGSFLSVGVIPCDRDWETK